MQLTIEKLVYGGDGLARTAAEGPARGKAVFVPFVLPGEQIEAGIVEEKSGFMRARAERIVQPSPERVEPRCPYFARCGGCHYQHTGYEHQLQIKTEVLAETVRRIAKIELPPVQPHASPPWRYRNRTRMKISQHDKTFALGYHRFNSHELLPVEECPISSPLINRAIAAVWQLGRAGQVAPQVSEIEFFASAEDEQLLVELTVADDYWKDKRKPNVVEFTRALRQSLPVAGVAVFRQDKQALVREEVPEKLKEAFGAEEITYRTRHCQYLVSAGSFFQTNRHLTDTLLDVVTGGRAGDLALDLYAGTGLFTLPLSQNFRQVAAVEAAPFSFHDLKRNTPSNVKALRQTTEEFLSPGMFQQLTLDMWTAQFDLVIVDPPRAGLGEHTASALAELRFPSLTYVSCDPATLARDLKVLLKSGFRIEKMHLVDLFPQTFHIESVTELVR